MASTHSIHEERSHGNHRGYLKGFVLSVVLTTLSFWVVRHSGLSEETVLMGLAVLAAVQVVVHLIFFLHLNTSSGQRWNVIAFGFAVLTVAIVIVGTLWILHNVSVNMMSR